ncbi:MAG: hypothetical protein KGJ23_05050 [Euryarchaeota archaeon]|nr:hypothetical protein [Euryarchaeota archaeon]
MKDDAFDIATEVRARQSRASRSGRAWELHVKACLESFDRSRLGREGVEILDGKKARRLEEGHPELYRLLKIPVVSRNFAKADLGVWGDIDLIAARDDYPVAIISCKTSFHARMTETLFYSLLYRTIKNLRVVVATPDAGTSTKGRWKSELGGPTWETALIARKLAEGFLAGLYVEDAAEFRKNYIPSRDGVTTLGGIVRPLRQLPPDLVRWADELGPA